MSRVLALFYDSDRGNTRVILENNQEYAVKGRPEPLIDSWCIACGASMEGRITAIRKLVHLRIKIPVLVSEVTGTILFPMLSRRSHEDNWWINDSMLVMMRAQRRDGTLLFFADGSCLAVPYDIRMIRRQKENCRRIREALQTMKLPEEIAPAGFAAGILKERGSHEDS